jgi:hypothetical protein
VNNIHNELDREQALFDCLSIPNDDVKLAIVKCLFNVPTDLYEAEEILKLLRVMVQRNVGAGKTEEVLSHIFWVFCKFACDG